MESAVADPLSQDANEWRIIGLTSVAHTLCHMSELVFAGLLLALLREFQLSPEQVTLLGASGYALMGIGAVPTGLWTDRWGARRVLIVYFFALAIAALGVALSPGVWALAASLTVLGAALSLYHPAGLALIAHGCRKRGQALGINGVAGNLGIAAGPAFGAFLAALGHWRLAYILIAVASLLAGVAMVVFRIDESARHERPMEPANDAPMLPPRIMLLFAAMLLGGFNYRCLMTALPTFLAHGATLPAALEQAAGLTFLVLLLGAVGQYVGGHAADRLPAGWLYVGLILATVPLALVMAHGNQLVVLLAAGGLAICLFGQQPVENTIVAHITPARRRSTFFGLKFVLTFGVGALGAPLVGVVWEETGSLAPVFDVFAGCALVMALFAGWFLYPRAVVRSVPIS